MVRRFGKPLNNKLGTMHLFLAQTGEYGAKLCKNLLKRID